MITYLIIIYIYLELYKIMSCDIVDIATIITPIIIAIFASRSSKKQDEKILKDNEINRKANFQSTLILSKDIEIILHTDAFRNYSLDKENRNVLLSDSKLISGMCYSFELILQFENLTNNLPSGVLTYEVELWDNSTDLKDLSGNIINFNFINSDMKYKIATIDKNKDTLISILCCVSKEEMELLKNYDNREKILNLCMKLSIKNTYGIITNCNVRGKLKLVGVEDVSNGMAGGSKKKWMLKSEEAYLEIKSIEELG